MSEKKHFLDKGFLGPFNLIDQSEALSCYESFFASIDQNSSNPQTTSRSMGGYHVRYDWAYRLATHPRVLDRMEKFLGEDILLWAMHFWYKPPHHPSWIPWHQDNTYWPMEPSINASAWITLGETFPENGCLQLVPESHLKAYPHVEMSDQHSAFNRGISSEVVDGLGGSKVLSMNPGEGVFFNETLIHGSQPNISDIPRVAFSLRYTTPNVVFDEANFNDSWKRDLRTVLVRGEDHFGHNPRMRWEAPDSWKREGEDAEVLA